jgi:hypothetical protein
MKPSFLFLFGGAGSAVIAGPCKPSPPSSSTGQADHASTLPEVEYSSTGSVATSTTVYHNPEVTQSHESDNASSVTSVVQVPSGSDSVSDWLPGGSSDSTWLPGSTPTPIVSGSFTPGQPEETQDSLISIETSSATETIGDITTTLDVSTSNAINTETGAIGTETRSDGQSTETGVISTSINTHTASDHESTVTDGDLPDITQGDTNTETGSNEHSTDAISKTETGLEATSNSPTGDSNTSTITKTGQLASETGIDAVSTEIDASSGINTDADESQTTDATEHNAFTLINTEMTSTKAPSAPESSGFISESTEVDNAETKTTAAGSEEIGTDTETSFQDDSQTTALNTDVNGSVTVGVTASTGSSQDKSETSSDGSDGQETTADSDTTALVSDATKTSNAVSPPGETSSGQPVETSPSESDAPGQETPDSATKTDNQNTNDATAAPTVTDSSPPKTTDPVGDATITSAPGPVPTTKSDDDGITSTLTVPPETFSPTTVSNDDWTTNTWITTTSEGSDEPTVVPVLIDCPGCGGKGHGIVVFGFPPTPNTLSKFPGLPKFSFPCIPGISPGYSSPPETHEYKEPDDEDKSSKTTCTEIITASDCLVSCPTQDSNGEVECTTTCTRTQTGCSVSGITTTTSAEECSATEIGGSCTTCQKDVFFVNDNEEVEFIEDDSVLERRASLEPIEDSAFGKRSSPAVTITDLGVCTLKRTDVEFP